MYVRTVSSYGSNPYIFEGRKNIFVKKEDDWDLMKNRSFNTMHDYIPLNEIFLHERKDVNDIIVNSRREHFEPIRMTRSDEMLHKYFDKKDFNFEILKKKIKEKSLEPPKEKSLEPPKEKSLEPPKEKIVEMKEVESERIKLERNLNELEKGFSKLHQYRSSKEKVKQLEKTLENIKKNPETFSDLKTKFAEMNSDERQDTLSKFSEFLEHYKKLLSEVKGRNVGINVEKTIKKIAKFEELRNKKYKRNPVMYISTTDDEEDDEDLRVKDKSMKTQKKELKSAIPKQQKSRETVRTEDNLDKLIIDSIDPDNCVNKKQFLEENVGIGEIKKNDGKGQEDETTEYRRTNQCKKQYPSSDDKSSQEKENDKSLPASEKESKNDKAVLDGRKLLKKEKTVSSFANTGQKSSLSYDSVSKICAIAKANKKEKKEKTTVKDKPHVVPMQRYVPITGQEYKRKVDERIKHKEDTYEIPQKKMRTSRRRAVGASRFYEPMQVPGVPETKPMSLKELEEKFQGERLSEKDYLNALKKENSSLITDLRMQYKEINELKSTIAVLEKS